MKVLQYSSGIYLYNHFATSEKTVLFSLANDLGRLQPTNVHNDAKGVLVYDRRHCESSASPTVNPVHQSINQSINNF